MVVPQPRLLFWFGAVAVPFAVLAAALPHALFLSLVLITALLVLLAADLLLALGKLDGIQVKAPHVLRVSLGRTATLDLEIRRAGVRALPLRVGLDWPAHLESPTEDQHLQFSAGEDSRFVRWTVQPRRRGRFELGHAYLETSSALGFWALRSQVACPMEIRVYPDLVTERKQMAGLFLNRGSYGIHARRQVGKGREFEQLREYIPGDGYEDVHWKATAKRGHPVTKIFQIERTQEIYVVVDTSRLSARPAAPFSPTAARSAGPPAEREPMLERYLSAALILGLVAERQGDLFGLITFHDKVEVFLRAQSGPAHYHACRDVLYTAQPKPVTPDYEELATFIRLRLRRRALLVFLTALDDPILAQSFLQGLDLIARQHLVLVSLLKTTGTAPLFSAANVATLDDLYDRLSGHLQWAKLRELQSVLERRGVTLALLDHHRFSAQIVSQYLDIKRRQIL